MKRPSVTSILSGLFLVYVFYSIWTLAQLFIPPSCNPKTEPCLQPLLKSKPQLQLLLLSSQKRNPSFDRDLTLIKQWTSFDWSKSVESTVNVTIPRTCAQGTALHLFAVLGTGGPKVAWRQMLENGRFASTQQTVTKLHDLEALPISLLGESKETVKKKKKKPVPHLLSKVSLSLMEDQVALPQRSLPAEMARIISLTEKGEYFPLIHFDSLNTRLRDLVPIGGGRKSMEVTVLYTPISFGKFRLFLQVEAAMQSLKTLGFSEKDMDEVRGIFADTHLMLLCVTFFIAAFHLLLDFLAFKNDISFWRSRRTVAGLSPRTVAWRAFSQFVVFLFLMDEGSSLLVVFPAAVGTLIEVWKVFRVFRISIEWTGRIPRLQYGTASEAEKETARLDAESVKYLSWLLYPLCIGGAVYSLIYQPHRSWYSWCINSLANGVYAFGFLFMLPQLFVNYRLKSVAHLPWRAFMYKAFNTFIDDLFAFIITMPTAHRVACFRDDVVFLIYLYQRWLYPVDKSRLDVSTAMDESVDVRDVNGVGKKND